ncbi:MAG: nuclear transport factor 2 family protein [Pseudomonadales bacterium]|jgi:hypothetical protein|nr:nuclear transport factor 2 family protein [Pseudomonadales bacterium]|tara:strand:+ start:483 stop:929 length:447 start_codon:yes stop_codon:yes gene_type:complete
MVRAIISSIILLIGSSAFADASQDLKKVIEEHYSYINTADYGGASKHHRDDFTMYFPDGGPLWESDYDAVADRMKATPNFPEMNLLMSNYEAQVYDSWALVTFYLSGTHTRNGKIQNIVNRVSAVWVHENGRWLEVHHHESPLSPLKR